MQVARPMVAKAVATMGRTSPKETVARAKSSAYAQAHRKTGSNAMVSEQKATHRTALLYAPHDCKLPSSSAGMLNISNRFGINSSKEELQCFRNASPFQHQEDPPVVDLGHTQQKSVSKMPGLPNRRRAWQWPQFGSQRCHDTLGDAPLGRVIAFDGVSP